ncbi:aspartyl protease family protein [Asaia prunellae]|uniref:aspartyl protease family protein n=1 Tax=Asaia prunellae TaxID=610245 RepID=UPI00046EAEAB|nr:retropepsin-like aspartic protease [Asaia prunellae]
MSLSGNDSITAKIEGRDREMTLDSDVPVTTLPARWLSGSERNDTNPTIALYGALRTRLFRTTVSSFRIGDITLDGMSAYAQQDLGVGLLGVDFFQSHMVLFDYPNRKVYLLSARSQIARVGTGLHFDRIREGQTHVSERP